ncbi:Uncharacterized protein AC516_0224 [Pseudomonas amygdali pv. sesami]|nr:Uncharacterized protein AC516_0224 [Pseudomonas amygdali pv. sesami]
MQGRRVIAGRLVQKLLPKAHGLIPYPNTRDRIHHVATGCQRIDVGWQQRESRQRPAQLIHSRHVVETFKAQVIRQHLLRGALFKAGDQCVLSTAHVPPDHRALDRGSALVDRSPARLMQLGHRRMQRVFLTANTARHHQLLHQQRAGMVWVKNGVSGAQREQLLARIDTLSQMTQAIAGIVQQYTADLPLAGVFQHIDYTGLRFPEHPRIDGLGIRFDRQTGEQRVGHRCQLQAPDILHSNTSASLSEKCLGFSEGLDRKLPRQITQIPRRMIEQPFITGLAGALRCSQADWERVVSQIQPGRLDRGDECLGDRVFGIKAGKRIEHCFAIGLALVQVLEAHFRPAQVRAVAALIS